MDQPIENSNQVTITPRENGFFDLAQEFQIIPRPELSGKTIICKYAQVQIYNHN